MENLVVNFVRRAAGEEWSQAPDRPIYLGLLVQMGEKISTARINVGLRRKGEQTSETVWVSGWDVYLLFGQIQVLNAMRPDQRTLLASGASRLGATRRYRDTTTP